MGGKVSEMMCKQSAVSATMRSSALEQKRSQSLSSTRQKFQFQGVFEQYKSEKNIDDSQLMKTPISGVQSGH